MEQWSHVSYKYSQGCREQQRKQLCLFHLEMFQDKFHTFLVHLDMFQDKIHTYIPLNTSPKLWGQALTAWFSDTRSMKILQKNLDVRDAFFPWMLRCFSLLSNGPWEQSYAHINVFQSILLPGLVTCLVKIILFSVVQWVQLWEFRLLICIRALNYIDLAAPFVRCRTCWPLVSCRQSGRGQQADLLSRRPVNGRWYCEW